MGKLLKIMLKTISGVITAIIMVEILLRILGFSPGRVYVYDEVLVRKLKPDNSIILIKPCYRVKIKTNSLGFNDIEHHIQKTKPRIAFIGDSFVEALQVDSSKTFFRLLQNELPDFEILAFGIGSLGIFQEYLIYEKYVKKFNPDLIILMIYPSNDIFDSSLNLGLEVYNKTGDKTFILKPFPVIYKSSFSVYYHSAVEEYRKKEFIKNIASKTAIYGYLRTIEIYSVLRRIKSKLKKEKKELTFETVEEISPDKSDYDIFEFFVKKFPRNTIFVIIPDNREIEKDYKIKWKNEIIKILRNNNFTYFDMTEYFKKRFKEENKIWYQPCEGHWGETGHIWVKDFIKGVIQEVIKR